MGSCRFVILLDFFGKCDFELDQDFKVVLFSTQLNSKLTIERNNCSTQFDFLINSFMLRAIYYVQSRKT